MRPRRSPTTTDLAGPVRAVASIALLSLLGCFSKPHLTRSWSNATISVSGSPRSVDAEAPTPTLRLGMSAARGCLQLSPDARASVDGMEIPLTRRGGLPTGTDFISGIEIPNTECNRPRFELQHQFSPRPHSQIVVEDGRRSAIVEVDWLFGPPTMEATAKEIAVGQEVTLELRPDDASWPAYDVLSTLRLSPATQDTLWVAPKGLRWDHGRVRFTMPDTRHDTVTISMVPTYDRELTVTQCSGVAQCVLYAVAPMRQVELEVVTTGGAEASLVGG